MRITRRPVLLGLAALAVGPWRALASLEPVRLASPMRLRGYFKNCTILCQPTVRMSRNPASYVVHSVFYGVGGLPLALAESGSSVTLHWEDLHKRHVAEIIDLSDASHIELRGVFTNCLFTSMSYQDVFP